MTKHSGGKIVQDVDFRSRSYGRRQQNLSEKSSMGGRKIYIEATED